jgi:hypothetical protein
MQHNKTVYQQMNFGMSETIDRILFEEIDSMPENERVAVLRQELEAVLCGNYEMLGKIMSLEKQINKLLMYE